MEYVVPLHGVDEAPVFDTEKSKLNAEYGKIIRASVGSKGLL